jgi:hypothetical protein
MVDDSFNFSNLEYKDESWNYIKNINKIFNFKRFCINWKIHDNDCVNKKIINISKSKIIVKSYGIYPEDWIYLIYNKYLGNNYCLSFSTIVYSVFTEFQIAFKHKSISERLRFRIVENKYVVFEVVNKGFFSKALSKKPFSFILGNKYNVKLIVKEWNYSFIVNDQTLLTISDKKKKYYDGGIALIFWDKCQSSKIDFLISELELILL